VDERILLPLRELQSGRVHSKKTSLEQAAYLKKEGDQLTEKVLPHSFAITQFHIVCMYPRNITVLSKISKEIVYCCKFDETQDPLAGHMPQP
jgi:hypothetical protein